MAREREAYWLPGGTSFVEIRLGGDETGGELALIELVAPPGGEALPHRHTREHETIVVLEGELQLSTEAGDERLGPGEAAFMPRGVMHGFENVGSGAARILFVASPAGLEGFFREIGSRKAGDRPPDLPEPDGTALAAAAERAGLEFPPAPAA